MNMDFTIPLTSSLTQNPTNTLSFTDLLNSQPEIVSPKTFFQTHFPYNQTSSTKSKEPKLRWKVPEEKAFVSTWLNTSKDPIVGTRQKEETFWQRVAHYYAACPDVANLPKRNTNVCKQKWRTWSESVSKFCGSHDYATRSINSGRNDKSIMELAYERYYTDQKVKFILEHAWRLLRYDQKWCTFITSKSKESSKKPKLSDTISSKTAFNVEEETEERPLGVKAAKMKEKKRGQGKGKETKGIASLKVLEQVWAIRDKDNVAKEKLSNKQILEDLIAKLGGLSEIEVDLKNTHESEMLKHLGYFYIEKEHETF